MIRSIDHNPSAYFYMNRYEIWPAQHDSNVRPGPWVGIGDAGQLGEK
jgi:hypothetical protein